MNKIKPLKIKLKIIEPNIIFCPNKELYEKEMKKYKGLEEYFYRLYSIGLTSIIKDDKLNLIIGVDEHKNIYEIKAVIVHELNHAVTEIMNYYGFTCDEFRSYTLQSMYLDIMPYYDNYLESKKIEA